MLYFEKLTRPENENGGHQHGNCSHNENTDEGFVCFFTHKLLSPNVGDFYYSIGAHGPEFFYERSYETSPRPEQRTAEYRIMNFECRSVESLRSVFFNLK
jgi:hypothetical protein